MASFDDITLTKGVWTDVSDAVGEAAGTNLLVSNVSASRSTVRVEVSVGVPSSTPIKNGPTVPQDATVRAEPAAGESVWATSEIGDPKISVQLTV